MKPTTEQFESYQKLFDYFNEHLFGGFLPNVILNFSRKNQVAGFFSRNSWKYNEGKECHEISINPTSLCHGKKYVIQTLVHEMCHLWQHEFGKPSRTGYHNKQWSHKMESCGLMPSDTGKEGGNMTGQKMSDYLLPGGKLEKLIEAMPEEIWLPLKSLEYMPEEIIDEILSELEDNDVFGEMVAIKNPKPKSKNKVKFSCPGCGLNVWGKETVRVICADCGVLLERN